MIDESKLLPHNKLAFKFTVKNKVLRPIELTDGMVPGEACIIIESIFYKGLGFRSVRIPAGLDIHGQELDDFEQYCLENLKSGILGHSKNAHIVPMYLYRPYGARKWNFITELPKELYVL